MEQKSQPKLPRPDFVSGPAGRNFNLSSWTFVINPKTTELTPDEATHLRDALNKYLEYIDKDNWA